MHDVLERCKSIHEERRDELIVQKRQLQDPEVESLLDFVVRREGLLIDSIDEALRDDPGGRPSTFLQNLPEARLDQCQRGLPIDSRTSIEEFVIRNSTFDDRVIRLYAELSAQSGMPRVSELFDNLAEQVSDKRRELTRRWNELRK